MLIIIDKNTKKVINNMGTNSLFPDGNIPNVVLKENEEAIRIHDDSDLVQDILDAHEYELELQGTDCIHVNVIKSKEEYMHEQKQSPEYKRKDIKDKLVKLDSTRDAEDLFDVLKAKGILSDSDLTQKVLERFNKKKELRQQLQALQGGDS